MSKKRIKQIYIYRDSHLPSQGWLQSCFHCYSITSHNKLFDIYNTNKNNIVLWEIYIYLCPKCKRLLNNDKLEYKTFNKEYEKYLFKNYQNLYKSIQIKKTRDAVIKIQTWWKKRKKILYDNEITL